MKLNIVLLFCFLSFLLGCATSYKSVNYTELQPGIFSISLHGKNHTKPEQIRDFALLKAAELAIERNIKYFVILDKESEKSTMYVSNAYATTYGGTNSASIMGGSIPITKHSIELLVGLVDIELEGYACLDAEFLYNSITKKYNMNR